VENKQKGTHAMSFGNHENYKSKLGGLSLEFLFKSSAKTTKSYAFTSFYPSMHPLLTTKQSLVQNG
jgi:hypothetical protein